MVDVPAGVGLRWSLSYGPRWLAPGLWEWRVWKPTRAGLPDSPKRDFVLVLFGLRNLGRKNETPEKIPRTKYSSRPEKRLSCFFRVLVVDDRPSPSTTFSRTQA